MEPILSIKGMSKSFPGVKALDKVDFELYPGEVHIIVGENGAGKSTMTKCILGAYIPEEGEMFINGEKVKFKSSRDAIKKGITAVYQEFNLIPYLDVAQNIFFNREFMSKIPGVIDIKKMHLEAEKILKSLDVDYINTKSKIKDLGVAEKQMVEIAKALSTEPKIIVFDEPTAPLSSREVDAFFKKVLQLKKSGIAVIYISHRMHEFELIGDRITVLRDGKYIGTVKIGDINDDELVEMMVGRTVSQIYSRTDNEYSKEALRVENLYDKKGNVIDVSLSVRRGEIVGLAGLVGAGRTELARLIFGIDKIDKGSIYVNGAKVIPRSPTYMMKMGVGLLPEDRKEQGLALSLPVSLNIIAVSLRKIFTRMFINKKIMGQVSNKYIKELNIITPSVNSIIKYLSGGNQQKVVIAKWLSSNSDIIIFDEPTRGIDVGAKMEIYALMDRLASEGKAILMISSELQEVIGLSDRFYILYEGRVVSESKKGELSEQAIGMKMLAGR